LAKRSAAFADNEKMKVSRTNSGVQYRLMQEQYQSGRRPAISLKPVLRTCVPGADACEARLG
jgi:hypothetical protein